MKVEYNDTKLRRFYAQLPMVQRTNAVRAAERRVANQAKREAMRKFIATGVKNANQVAKIIRGIAFKKKLGFRVTGGRPYQNARGNKKPVLRWFEDGTQERKTKGRGRIQYVVGSIAPVKFMAKTKEEMTPKVTEAFHEALRQSVMRIAKKNGAK